MYCSCNPKCSLISHHKYLDVLTAKFDNIILISDFNAELTGTVISDFCETCNLKNIRGNACFENTNNPSCIDSIIVIRPKSFENSTVETVLSDFHKMCITVMEMYYSK